MRLRSGAGFSSCDAGPWFHFILLAAGAVERPHDLRHIGDVTGATGALVRCFPRIIRVPKGTHCSFFETWVASFGGSCPAFAISVGFVVTPSTAPHSTRAAISSWAAVSGYNLTLVPARHAALASVLDLAVCGPSVDRSRTGRDAAPDSRPRGQKKKPAVAISGNCMSVRDVPLLMTGDRPATHLTSESIRAPGRARPCGGLASFVAHYLVFAKAEGNCAMMPSLSASAMCRMCWWTAS